MAEYTREDILDMMVIMDLDPSSVLDWRKLWWFIPHEAIPLYKLIDAERKASYH